MNDKIHLFLPSSAVEQNQNFDNNFSTKTLTIENPITSEVTTLVQRHCNTENYNVDVSDRGLLIKMNPNKVAKQTIGSGHLSYFNFISAVEQVEQDISEKGINCHLLNAKLTRADNSFDLQTTLSYQHYLSLITELVPDRIRQGTKRIYENTLYYGNKSEQISIYNKQLESNLPEPVIRIELRHLKLKRAKLFLVDVSENRYYQFRSADKNRIESTIFDRNPKVLDSEYLQQFLLLTESDLSIGKINKELSNYVVQYEQQKTGIDLNRILSVGRTDTHYQRNRRILSEINSNRFFDVNLIERYNELKTLFKLAV